MLWWLVVLLPRAEDAHDDLSKDTNTSTLGRKKQAGDFFDEGSIYFSGLNLRAGRGLTSVAARR